MLLFYQCDEGETVDEHSVPRHMLGEGRPLCLHRLVLIQEKVLVCGHCIQVITC